MTFNETVRWAQDELAARMPGYGPAEMALLLALYTTARLTSETLRLRFNEAQARVDAVAAFIVMRGAS